MARDGIQVDVEIDAGAGGEEQDSDSLTQMNSCLARNRVQADFEILFEDFEGDGVAVLNPDTI